MHLQRILMRKNQLYYTKNCIKRNIIKEILNYVDKLKCQLTINKVLKNKLKQEIYRNIHKRKQDKINNELKKIKI